VTLQAGRRRSLFTRHLRSSSALLALLAVVSEAVRAQQAPNDLSPHSEIALLSEATAIQAGVPFTIALRLEIDRGWHTYWINAGDSGLPLEVAWELPDGFTAGPLRWPAPRLQPLPPLMSYGFENELVLLVDVTPPVTIRAGEQVALRGAADWLVCADVCLPASDSLTLTLPVENRARADESAAALIAAARDRLPRSLKALTANGWSDSSGYVVSFSSNGSAAWKAPYFFVRESPVVDHAKPQRIVRSGNQVWMRLPYSEFADSAAVRLSGVLVTDVNDPAGSAFEISVAVGAPTPEVAGLAFDGASLLLTGGFASVRSASEVPLPATSLFIALLLAFAGGLLLNLMPCVFPVLSVKALGLLESAQQNAAQRRRHGGAFVGGVLVSFWALAGLLFALRVGGNILGWGFQLQSPLVVAGLTLLLFSLALSLSGVFELGLGLTRLGNAGAGSRYRDSFITGALAVVVASPCTAPLMGGALGYALVQPAAVGLLVFTALALGFALPYALVSLEPRLLAKLPRPGRWMESLKQLLAFPVYATVVWLVWVFARQTGVDATAVLLLSLIGVAFGAWLWGRAAASTRGPLARLTAIAIIIVSLTAAASGTRATTMSSTNVSGAADSWERFSPDRVAALRAERRPVLVDFTAAWCLSCQVNERIALKSTAARRAFAAANVALVKADWTSRDPEILKALQQFGRSGVPLYVLYPADPNAAPEVLPTLLTPSLVVDAVARASSRHNESSE
jgi:thiol:disulfide interchange protein/DsbC/DsbD-like thiol-disulfide interchange protein